MAAFSSRLGAVSRRFLLLAATGLTGLAARAQEATVKLTYDDHIRPLLENKCFSCHNPDKKKGGLDLSSYASLVAGGSGGVGLSFMKPTAASAKKVLVTPTNSDASVSRKAVGRTVTTTSSRVVPISAKPSRR